MLLLKQLKFALLETFTTDPSASPLSQTNSIPFSEDRIHTFAFLKLPRGLRCAVRPESHCSKTGAPRGSPLGTWTPPRAAGGAGPVTCTGTSPPDDPEARSSWRIIAPEGLGVPTVPTLSLTTVPGPPPTGHPGLTQDAVEAQLLVTRTAVGHVPGLGDLHGQVPGSVDRLGASSPRDPPTAGGVGHVQRLDGLHLLDVSGHAGVAQLETQQGKAFF